MHCAMPTCRQPGKVRVALPQPVADAWLASFNDPALSALVAEALLYNSDLRAASALVEQANGYLRVAGAPLLPAVNLAGVWSGKSSSGGSGLNGIFLNASLELDIWGRVRYGRSAVEEQSVAVLADYAYARQSLAAMVAKSWFLADRDGPAARDRNRFAALGRGLAAGRRGSTAHRQRQRDCRSPWRARTSAACATACARSSCLASRRCARSSSCSVAIRRRRSRSLRPSTRCRRHRRSAFRRSCSNVGPTSSLRSAGSPPHSTGSAKRAPRSCRASA